MSFSNFKGLFSKLQSLLGKAILKVNNAVLSEFHNPIEDKFQFLFENSSQGIVFHNSTGEVVYCNKAAERILGLTEGQLKGLSPIHPRWKSFHEDGTDYPGDAHPAMLTLKTGKPVLNSIMSVYNPQTGSNTWININSLPYFKNSVSKAFDVIVTFEDITELKKTEMALAESRNRYQTFFEQGHDGVLLIDPETASFVEFNSQVCSQLGYSREEFENLTIFDIEAAETVEQTKDRIREVITNKGSDFVTKQITKTGEVIDISVSARIIEVAGKELYHCIWRDITELKRNEAELLYSKEKAEESNANIRAIIENTTSSIWAIDSRYHLTYVNEVFKIEFLKFFGETLEIGDDVIVKLPQRYRNIWRERYDRVFQNEQFIIEDKVEVSSDKVIYIQVSLNPIISKGKIIGASIFGNNITDRKTQEEELIKAKIKAEESEMKFRNAFEFSGIGMAMISLDKKFVKVNRALCTMLEFTEEELLGKTFPEITFKEDRNIGIEELKKTLKGELDFFNCTKRYSSKTGNITWGKLNVSIIRNTFKEPLFWVAQIEDITPRIKYEKDLIDAKEIAEESEKRFKALFRNMGNSASLYEVVKNRAGIPSDYRFLALNPEYEKVIGLNASQFVGKTMLEIFPNTESVLLELFKNVVLTGNSNRVESYSQEIDKFFEIIAYVPQEGQLALIGSDITERKKSENEREKLLAEIIAAKEKAEESDRLKTAFLQNMSHEIRTPMNAIMGFAELLPLNLNKKDKLTYFSNIIYNRCGDLLEIMNDILDLAKIESGQLSLYNEVCRLDDLFAEIAQLFSEQQVKMKKQHLLFNLVIRDFSQDLNLVADRIKLKQIFINLISNAFKFTENGKIEGGCFRDNNNQLIFYVSDTGMGIPEDKFEFIFNRFAQLEKSKSKFYGGTGLGLSIVKGLVGLMGGKIWLESKIDQGTTFYFTIHYEEQSYVPRPVTDEIPVNENLEISDKIILIVEDDPLNKALLTEFLSHFGPILIYADTGAEAITLAAEKNPDLILMDIGLPDMFGFDAVSKILEMNPKIKIIAQTAFATTYDRDLALKSGCVDYLSKPIKSANLNGLIKKYLS